VLKNVIYNLVVITSIFLSTLSNAQSCHSLSQLNWLLGEWQSKQGQLTVTEHWQQVSEKTIEGLGKTFKQNKAVSSETLRLVEMSDEVFYLAKVQHNAVPIGFKLIVCSTSNAVFENKNHDFPKRISYQLFKGNTLHVRVSDGKDKEFVIKFSKIDFVE